MHAFERLPATRLLRLRPRINPQSIHRSSSSTPLDVAKLLSTPHPTPTPPTPSPNDPHLITPTELHHLLRLSALPPPTTPEEETQLLASLTAQLHFVRQIQAVDTRGVEALASLRDETAEGQRAAQVGMEALKEALAKEEMRGRFHRRIRRRREDGDEEEAKAKWKVLEGAQRKVGRFFVVEGGQRGQEESKG